MTKNYFIKESNSNKHQFIGIVVNMQKAIIDYIVTLKKDNISYATVHVLLAPIYHFCEMADIVIKKKKPWNTCCYLSFKLG